MRCHPIFIPVFFPHCMQPESLSGALGLENRLLCPRAAVGQAREPPGGATPHRVQPLHLHVILGVEVHADGHRLHPGIVGVAWVIEVPPVHLCMGMPREQPSLPLWAPLGALGVGGHCPAGVLPCWRAELCSLCSWSPGESLQAQILVWAALPRGLWAAPWPSDMKCGTSSPALAPPLWGQQWPRSDAPAPAA